MVENEVERQRKAIGRYCQPGTAGQAGWIGTAGPQRGSPPPGAAPGAGRGGPGARQPPPQALLQVPGEAAALRSPSESQQYVSYYFWLGNTRKECFMGDDKIQTGLRIPQSRYEEIRKMAERSGTSVNALILTLVDIGLSAVNLGIQAKAHAETHSPLHTDER